MAVSASGAVAQFCIEYFNEYKDSAFIEQRMTENDLAGSAAYIAEGENKTLTVARQAERNKIDIIRS